MGRTSSYLMRFTLHDSGMVQITLARPSGCANSGGAFFSGSWHGTRQANTAWALKWKQRDADDATELAKRQVEAREEEQRRQGKLMRSENKPASSLLASRLMPIVPVLLLVGCTTGPINSPGNWQNVNAPAVPVLPAEARQKPAEPYCSPTCSAALTSERESWQERLMRQEPEGWPVKPHTVQ